MKKAGFEKLERQVIRKGLCTGCGTCVGVCSTGVLQFDSTLEEPVLKGTCALCGLCYSVCPGKDIPLPKLEKKFLREVRTPANELFGVSKCFFKGYARDPEIRRWAASGGLTTTLLAFGLDQGVFSGASVAAMDSERPWRVRPILARTKEEVIEAAKSKYVICPSNIVLRDALPDDRLAVVGLPCHIHGVRKLMSQRNSRSKLAQKVAITLGIFCGSNRSYKATEYIIQEYAKVSLPEVKRFEYRGGVESQDVKIYTHDGREFTITPSQRRTVFQSMTRDRCRMCCDWTGELADISLGDIFDPDQKMRKIPNWNGVIVRTDKGLKFLEKARKSGAIEIFPMEKEPFYGNVGVELKKIGAVHTFLERRRHGWPVPNYHYEFTWQDNRTKD